MFVDDIFTNIQQQKKKKEIKKDNHKMNNKGKK